MAYFRCGQGAGGNELKILITTTDTSLYGQTITISKDGSTVGTTTFDNTGNAEYTVDEAGLYTVSCGGASESVLVEDEYEVSLSAIPDGSTVTPVNDIQTWLNCAGIFNKTTYTTISDVLADTTTLLALINSNNAVDYMVRSHDWCDDVCADATAMTYIGANNYAADTLLADSNEGLVPVMTSDTTPEGECIASSASSANQYAFKAFDGNNTTTYHMSQNGELIGAYYLGYVFPSAKKITGVKIYGTSANNNAYYDIAVYGGDSLSALTKLSTDMRIQSASIIDVPFTTFANDTAYTTYVLKIDGSNVTTSASSGSNACAIYECQFYAKDGSWLESICNSTYFESVLNVKVPTMTSDTTPSGEAFGTHIDGGYPAYLAFNGNDADFSCWLDGYTLSTCNVGYGFTTKIKVNAVKIIKNSYVISVRLKGSDDKNTWQDFGVISTFNSIVPVSNLTKYKYYSIFLESASDTSGWCAIHTLQLYGRS